MKKRFSDFITHRLVFDDHVEACVADWLIQRSSGCIRYVIADLKNNSHSGDLLITPAILSWPSEEQTTLRALIAFERLRTGPSVDLSRSFSRGEEQRLVEHFGWPVYWLGNDINLDIANSKESEAFFADQDLTLASKLKGTAFRRPDHDGETIQDLIVDSCSWVVEFVTTNAKGNRPFPNAIVSYGDVITAMSSAG